MAAARSWRNAACIMMLSGPFKFCRPPNSPECFQKPFLQYTSEQREEPEIIFVQRHAKSGFMANVNVFPGGVLDKADYSSNWLSVFSDYKYPFASILSLRDSGLPIFKTVPQGSPLAGEVAFRICAIREFFEEAGILLARRRSEVKSVIHNLPGSFPPSVAKLPQAVLEEWRAKVHADASEFVTMCRKFEFVPDIWSLIELSDWLTPRNYTRRFDTIFYTCYTEEKPESSPDNVEVTNTKWIAPSQADKLFKENMMKFAPPQFSEIKKLQRMLQLGGAPLVHLFALYRSTSSTGIFCKKSSRIMVQGKTIVSVTELDDLCPQDSEDRISPVQLPRSPELARMGVRLTLTDNVNYEYEISDHTPDELRNMSTITNRIEYTPQQFTLVDTAEIKEFTDFLASHECTPSKL